MIQEILSVISDLCKSGIEFVWVFFATHFITLLGIAIGLLVMSRVLNERRNPSNAIAWFLVIVLAPFIGIILYFLLGGRKSKRMVNNKRAVRELAISLARGRGPSASFAAIDPEHPSALTYTAGNKFELLPDGVSAFKRLCREIDEARESIWIMTYILGRDEVGREVVERLTQRARQGVEVKLLIDAVGSLGQGGSFVRPLRQAGGRVARFMPVIPLQTKTSANLRNHRKIALFDHRRAITGGQNLDVRFMGPKPDPRCFVDFSAIVEGPAVAALNRHFISDWCFASGDAATDYTRTLGYTPEPVGDVRLQTVATGPDMVHDPLWEKLVTLIQECRKQVTLVTPYFIPDEVIFRSLIVKAHAGKKIRLILPEKSNKAIVDYARNHYLRTLHEEGIDIRFYQPGMVHAKLALIDNVAMIGSANIDMRSLFLNFEIGLFTDNIQPVSDLKKWADSLLPDCTPFKESIKSKPGAGRIFMEDLAHLAVPLL